MNTIAYVLSTVVSLVAEYPIPAVLAALAGWWLFRSGNVQTVLRDRVLAQPPAAPLPSGDTPLQRPVQTPGQLLDLLGRPVAVGDTVCWGAGGRKTAGLRIGVVTSIEEAELHRIVKLKAYVPDPDPWQPPTYGVSYANPDLILVARGNVLEPPPAQPSQPSLAVPVPITPTPAAPVTPVQGL